MKKVIEDFNPHGGKHCITNSLKQVFTYYGYPLTEQMIFGIASGLSFCYINLANSPMVSGRTKVFEFEAKLAKRLNMTIERKTGKDYPSILRKTKSRIDNNDPVLIYVDMAYLRYLQLDKNSHFGGHAVVLFGYDDTTEKFWISDRDNHDFPIRTPKGTISQDYHCVDYHEVEQARTSQHKPFPANNKYLVFDFNGWRPIGKEVLLEAIRETCETMLNPPASLLGINGIKKLSKEILKWNRFSLDKLSFAGITNYFQISHDGGDRWWYL